MNTENRETIQRALGIIDGVTFMVDEKTSAALATAITMIDEVMDKIGSQPEAVYIQEDGHIVRVFTDEP